nr:sulfatase-like hydrolase/transferase [Kofleriaceae bacterium]
MPSFRSLRDAIVADVGRAIWMAAGGAVVFVPVELALSVVTYSQPIPLASVPNLVLLVALLGAILWLVLAAATAALSIGLRVARSAIAHAPHRAPGPFVAEPPGADGVRPGVATLWAVVATAGVLGMLLQRTGAWAIERYKEPQLTAALIAVAGLVLAAAAAPLHRAFTAAARAGGAALAPMLRVANPLARWRAAGVALGVLAGMVLLACWLAFPTAREPLHARTVLAAIVIGFGMGVGALAHDRLGPRVAAARRRRGTRSQRTRGLVVAGASLVAIMATLLHFGGDPDAKYVAFTASPAFQNLIDLVRVANDVDGDGYGSLLGENDCDPFDSSIHPGAKEIPDDGIDQDCSGEDLSLRDLAAPSDPKDPIPDKFKRTDWNVLFITIDTVRYDETTMGGFTRDTTPRLAELAKKSTTFTFCNAPSAGTMASIPAIITSKYFHSGIALDENVPPHMPPRLKPENTTLPEIMKRAGYYTGVIASHEYWNDWGMEQGVDDYDNSIGKTPDPYRVCADKVTDHALAWIARQQGKKWFLWTHYIDPHGRYVAHPDVVDWSDTERDKYDSELKWTDQELGRLFDEMSRLPSWKHTIVIVTSDHGDSMGEHTVPLGTHGTALYRELQHVPMIFYIPDNAPHVIGGAVTNLDIVPTIADLVGIDVHDLSFEGKSEVGAIFYGKEDHDRIVFAETNLPDRQRAAISEKYKLIYYLNKGIYEFFDLTADPWEKTNLAPKHPASMDPMKSALDKWLERVMYARDSDFNQQIRQMKDALLGSAAPAPATGARGALDDQIDVLGASYADGSAAVPGSKLDVFVYMTAHDRESTDFKFSLTAWPTTDATVAPDVAPPVTALHTSPHLTADGALPSSRWRPGEYIRERFTISVPKGWTGTGLAVAVVATDKDAPKTTHLHVIGVLPLQAPAAPPPPEPPQGSNGSAAP